MLLLYVDDLFLTEKEKLIKDAGRRLASKFKIKYFGMEVWQSADGISIGQGKYAVEILKRFRIMDCKAMATPMALKLKLLSYYSSESIDATMYRQMIGSLMYLMNKRPNMCFAVNTLRHVHLMVAKHVVRYLNGTVDYGLKYEANHKINLEGYVDSDWAVPLIGRALFGVVGSSPTWH